MKANIIKKARLTDIPAGSGMEYINGFIYMVGDESSFLYGLDHDLRIRHKVGLFQDNENKDVFPKKEKGDLESITHFNINGYPHLLLLGSGSKGTQRDQAFLVKLPTSYNRNHLVWQKDLSMFYSLLKSYEEMSGMELNIEGAATSEDFIVLFNRGRKNSANIAFLLYLEEFVEFIQGHTESVPFPKIQHFTLPEDKGQEYGFSGATIHGNKLFFTATIEHSKDAYEDGKIGGSIIGWKEVNRWEMLRGSETPPIGDLKSYCTIEDQGRPYAGKVESIAIFEQDSDTNYAAIAVTDNDDGTTELLMLEISI